MQNSGRMIYAWNLGCLGFRVSSDWFDSGPLMLLLILNFKGVVLLLPWVVSRIRWHLEVSGTYCTILFHVLPKVLIIPTYT